MSMGECCRGEEATPTAVDRPASRDVLSGLRLEGASIAWMVTEAAVSIGAGVAAGSLLLVAFGVDSVIELLSALVLFHRLWQEYRAAHADEASLEALERRAGRIAGFLLYALCAYVVLQALWGLTHRHAAEVSFWGIGIALIAAAGMPLLARAKIHVAERIHSAALRADAMETFTCGYLSWVLLAGLLANAVFHWWWLDAAASLLIVPLLLREAREAMTGECGCAETPAGESCCASQAASAPGGHAAAGDECCGTRHCATPKK
jgi:divalent metal cation (Fe/Co/Zn/Cd) transporter